jgi:HAD superfamily hydrolase (TIGR01509 family)
MKTASTLEVAVIFDMDGVLVLTEEAHWKSWLEAARPRGAELSYAAFKSCFGRINPDCIPILFGPRSPEDSLAIAEEKESAFRRIVRARVPLVPGIVQLLTSLSNLGARLAVGSSGPPENVKALVEGGGIAHFFGATVDGAQVRRGKPAPDVFLIGAERLGVSPRACAVIEDAPVGIRAAVAADMLPVGVATTHPEAELREAGATFVYRDPAAIDPVQFVQLLRERACANA